MSDFVSEQGQATALADLTNKMVETSIDEYALRVKEQGWVDKVAFDTYMTSKAMLESSKSGEASKDSYQWAATAVKYEWREEYGDIGPKDEELEEMLFAEDKLQGIGPEFDNIAEINATIESERKVEEIRKFEDAGLHPIMLSNIKLCGYVTPTTIQRYVLPAIYKDIDIIGISQTGSGKTAAFLIPVLSKLMGKARKLAAPRPDLSQDWNSSLAVRGEPLVLVIAPTRELVLQTFDECRRLCYRSMLRPCVVYGGAPTAHQITEIQKGCDILIATPGRLCDFLRRTNLLSLRRLKYTIIDEADEMITDDWSTEMNMILGGDNNMDDDHVYMMFSATFPKGARQLARTYMANDHVRIRVGRAGSSHKNITQTIVQVDESKKQQALEDLLLSLKPARTIIFVNNKSDVERVDADIWTKGLPSTFLNSDRNQIERETAMTTFRNGKTPIMVNTGVAARGLDVKDVRYVINYDLPSSAHGGIDEYTHRIGRTGRIGHVGEATSFFNERNEDIAEALTKVLLEQKQNVPDFLQRFVPSEGEALSFDDDSDKEGEEINDGAAPENANGESGDAWGSNADSNAGWG